MGRGSDLLCGDVFASAVQNRRRQTFAFGYDAYRLKGVCVRDAAGVLGFTRRRFSGAVGSADAAFFSGSVSALLLAAWAARAKMPVVMDSRRFAMFFARRCEFR